MRPAALFILWLTSYPLAAQSAPGVPILQATSYQKGLYQSFDEFRNNAPSLKHPFVFDGRKLWRTDTLGNKLERIKPEAIWGFSNGTQLFISWNKFNQLTELGRFCYFQENGVRILFGVAPFPLLILPLPMPYSDEVIVSINTGTVYVLRKKVMRNLLREDDPDLYAQYRAERKKKKRLHDYLTVYNSRNGYRIR